MEGVLFSKCPDATVGGAIAMLVFNTPLKVIDDCTEKRRKERRRGHSDLWISSTALGVPSCILLMKWVLFPAYRVGTEGG